MRPINSVPSSPSSTIHGVKFWESPIPYLFGGLALMLILISVALVILVCSYRKRPDSSSDSAEDMKQAMSKTNSEPEVLVIMAGDNKPTYLAKPITPSNYCTCGGAEPTTTLASSSTAEQRVLTN